MAITGAGAVGTPSYLNSTYGRAAYVTDAGAGNARADAGRPSSGAAATVVTLSAAAQAKLANATTDFATVTADARAALDARYASAKVTGPLADGEPTIDLSALDRRALHAIAANGGGKFSADEQKVAAGELDARFDTMLSQQASLARLTGDWSRIYQAAIDYAQAAGPEEKATDAWKAQLAALQKGHAAAQAAPGSPPAAGSGDAVAAYVARAAATDGDNLRSFSKVANDVRTALDLQKTAAADKGLALVFDPARKTGQLADLSGFDNRALSAIALNQDDRFAPEEIRGAKTELDARTRAALLAAFKQSGSSSDPRALSLSVLSSYVQMSAEERQATRFTIALRDEAVKNYQAGSNLISMLQQASAGLGGLFG